MIYLAIGRRERGKTTLVYSLARKLPQRIIIDPRRQFESQAPRATTPDQVVTWIDTLYARPEVTELIVTPDGAVQPCFDAVMEQAQQWIKANPQRAFAIIVDEARFFDLETESFQWVLRCAPRDTVHVFITAHRPKDDEIPTSIQSIADQWLLFHTTQAHDLKPIRERCGDDVADRVSKLAAYQWVQWDEGKGECFEHKDAKRWYVPLRSHVEGSTVLVMDEGTPAARAGRMF